MSEPDDIASKERIATLIVRRTIRASAEKLFAAWTVPEVLSQWWGPEGVHCPHAEINLQAGGHYRIANQFPDGTMAWIVGIFEVVEPPNRLVYTWRLESQSREPERVIVSFEPHGASTEVIVIHERIEDAAIRTGHEAGWNGCLDALVDYLERGVAKKWR